MYIYKWSQDLMYKNNVSKKKEKKKDTYYPYYIPQNISILLLTKWSYTNSPPKNDHSHIQNYSPFLSRVTKGKSVK